MSNCILRSFVAIAVTSLLGGCGSVATGPAVRNELSVAFTPDQMAMIKAADSKDYQIRRGDVLSVRDMYNEVLNQEQVLVLPDGKASFFGLDPIKVAGQTIDALDEMLTTEYGKDFRDPRISVAVASLSEAEVYVMGQVQTPGKYQIPTGGFSVLGAIADAGGFANGANRGAIVIVRLTQQGYLCREIDLSNFEVGRSFDPVLTDLQPYDVIYVSRSAIGEFAAFTSSLITSLLSYTQLAVDVKYVTEGNVIRR